MAPKKQKCGVCAKKHLISCHCSHCNGYFCMNHKMPELHECVHEFKKKDSFILEKCVPIKIQKI